MARLGRSPSRNALAVDEATALLANQTHLSQGSGCTCTCGAGDELEAERQRIVQRSSDLGERGENLLIHETELEDRVLGLESRKERVAAAGLELRRRHAEFEAKLAQVDSLLREAAKRQEGSRLWEQMLAEQAEQLRCLEVNDIQAKEEAVAQEELALIEQRNRVEGELEAARHTHTSLESEALAHERQAEAEVLRMGEVEREVAALGDDEVLLTEIESQLEPIRRSLEAREARMHEEERRLIQQQAICEEEEASALPPWHESLNQLEALEERARELDAREEESAQQQLRLLQRQRNLGGAEIRLSGLEGALQRQDGASGRPSVRGESEVLDADEMHQRLLKLRRAEATWGERVREQQAETQRLEVKLKSLEARATNGSKGMKNDRLNVKRM